MGAHAFPFRPAEVQAASLAEANPTAAYLAAADLVPAFSRRHKGQADDVASLARLLLASVMADGLTGSLAAGAAVNQAAARLAEQAARHLAESPAGDTMATAAEAEAEGTPLEYLPRATYPAPDRLARVTDGDRLATVLAASDLTPAEAAAVAVMARYADAWGTGHGAEAGQPNGPAILRHLEGAGAKRGRRSQAMADAARAGLATLDAGSLPAWVTLPALNGAEASHGERGTLRDTRIPTSGPAGPCVRTVASGYWLTLADRSIRLSEAEAIGALYRTDALPAATVATARRDEELRAMLAAPATLAPMRRPAGVGIGMTYGTTGQRAGEGYAEQRPATGGRKRRRDGGIGSPMVTGATGYGHGPAGKAADAGQRPTAADLKAARVAAMTPAQQANLARLERASHAAAADLRATLAADLPGSATAGTGTVAWQYDAATLAEAGTWHGRG